MAPGGVGLRSAGALGSRGGAEGEGYAGASGTGRFEWSPLHGGSSGGGQST